MFRSNSLKKACVALSLLCAAALPWPTLAQPKAALPLEAVPSNPHKNPRIDRIRHEDALTRVDELRVGGETRSIAVEPKNGAAAYEITPLAVGANPLDARQGSAGKSRWQLFKF